MKKRLYYIFNKIKFFFKTYIFVDKRFVVTQNFKREDTRLDLRGTYNLNADSVIFDLGGYTGEWALKMWKKYGCEIYIFEPVESFLNQAKKKFENNPKIHFYDFGLSDKDGKGTINIENDASSVFTKQGGTEVKFRDVASVVRELGIQKIDLLKINIEGGEFKVLPRMIKSELIPLCVDIQVQFHHFYPEAERLREEIRASLKKTHQLTYDYPFTFENWRRNDK